MIKKWLPTALTLSAFTALCTLLLIGGSGGKAFAATTDLVPKCSNTQLETWDWPDKVATPYVTTPSVKNGGGITGFNPTTSSYIILQESSVGSGRNVYVAY